LNICPSLLFFIHYRFFVEFILLAFQLPLMSRIFFVSHALCIFFPLPASSFEANPFTNVATYTFPFFYLVLHILMFSFCFFWPSVIGSGTLPPVLRSFVFPTASLIYFPLCPSASRHLALLFRPTLFFSLCIWTSLAVWMSFYSPRGSYLFPWTMRFSFFPLSLCGPVVLFLTGDFSCPRCWK